MFGGVGTYEGDPTKFKLLIDCLSVCCLDGELVDMF